jgi:hypothetical protein
VKKLNSGKKIGNIPDMPSDNPFDVVPTDCEAQSNNIINVEVHYNG